MVEGETDGNVAPVDPVSIYTVVFALAPGVLDAVFALGRLGSLWLVVRDVFVAPFPDWKVDNKHNNANSRKELELNGACEFMRTGAMLMSSEMDPRIRMGRVVMT
ncbi:hypothetical protein K469DRAFT_687404 [Zopfia rhizophila CBS 207.26]|uniref:Uncharacterized protein n=1 Tax=Zopfia rhizophila CBS 207.26 TaxID=1314779 RepID=A0A6A6E4N3_9PEZI|nr:hypothetical protein K469DRAFT_687404 [Zopfia rhizophila CBS 207.26]